MKHLLVILSVLFSFSILAETASLKDIPSNVFVNKGKTDFETLLIQKEGLKEKIKILFQQKDLLQHEFSKFFDSNANFDNYWKVHAQNWYEVTFNKHGDKLLLYYGKVMRSDIKEHVEIYKITENGAQRLWADHGNLLAYQYHPYTKELVLYQHKYPCCNSASHTIIQLRFIDGEILTKDRFFVGRDTGDMVGPFYPDSVRYPKKFEHLEEKTLLRWSPAVVSENAFLGRTQENKMIHFKEGAIYQVLFSNEEWDFVLMFNGINEEQSMVLNHTNFINRPIYGWMRRKKPKSL